VEALFWPNFRRRNVLFEQFDADLTGITS